MKISIAIAAYNGHLYIEDQLLSIFGQTVVPDEVIITDDSTTNDTEKAIRKVAKTTGINIRYFRNKERLGYGDNFLKAASLCGGEIIFFCDQDDVWHETKIERVARRFSEIPECALVVHSAHVVDQDLKHLGYNFPDIKREHLYKPLENDVTRVFPGFVMAFKRSLLDIMYYKARPHGIHGNEELQKMPHDRWVAILANVCGFTLLLPDGLTLYRQHSDNICGFKKPRLKELLKNKISHNSQYYEKISINFENIAKNLNEQTNIVNPEYNANIEKLAAMYDRLSRSNSLRAQLYADHTGCLPSVAFLIKAFVTGTYDKPKAGGLGFKAFLKDILHTMQFFVGQVLFLL